MSSPSYLLIVSMAVISFGLLIAWRQNSLQIAAWLPSEGSIPSTLLSVTESHRFATQVLSVDPLMMYLDGFLHPDETKHLIKLGEPLFQPSKVYVDSGEKEAPLPSYRTSSSCILPGNDTIVASVKQRALAVMGFIPYAGVEALQLVKYGPSELFGLHYDWFDEPVVGAGGERYNRVASFFLYLDANCTSGATYFPKLPAPPEGLYEDRFSTTKNRTGLAIVPRLGSGVFWMNLKDDGTGDERTLHAGLPVREGSKIGMNIWIKSKVDGQ